MGKSNKKRKDKHSSHSEERNIPIKKVSTESFKGKELKKKLKKSTTVYSDAVLMSKPTIPTSQEHHPKPKKKKKKPNCSTEKSKNHKHLPLQNFFDSMGNVNDFGESPTLTDTKSFFTPQKLKPEECVIHYVKMSISPKVITINNHSVENETAHIVPKPTYEPVDADQNRGDRHNVDADVDVDANEDIDVDIDDDADEDFDVDANEGIDEVTDVDIDDVANAGTDGVAEEEITNLANGGIYGDAEESISEVANGGIDVVADLEIDGVAEVDIAGVDDVDAYSEELFSGRNTDVEDHRNMQETLTEPNALQFHKLPNNKYLVEMKHQQNVFIMGQLNVQVLFGSVEILGWRVNDASDKSVALFSPRGSGNLCLEPRKHSSQKLHQVENTLTDLGLDSIVAAKIVNRIDGTKTMEGLTSLVLFERSESTLYSFLHEHYPSLSLYSPSLETSGKFNEMESKLKCHVQSSVLFGHCYEKSLDWDVMAEEVKDDFIKKGRSRLVVCGGKGVGKSTLLRFLVNRSIQAHGEVLYLDFDPGQSEFTVPGCVSVLKLTEPVLGPNYTHVRTPERSIYLGHINIDECPDQYIQGVQDIIDYCQSIPELNKMVWLINTMGHSRDLGIEMNMTVIGLVQPTRVAQIVSRAKARNFPVPLLPENVLEGRGRWCPPPGQLDFKLFQLHSMADVNINKPMGLQPQILRDFLMLAYFHKILAKKEKFLSDVIPYRASLSGLTVGVLHTSLQPADVLGAMNAALVALCEIGPDADVLEPDDDTLPRVLSKPQVCPCLGFGVVRGIDVESRTLYITTPLPPSRLQAVNCVTRGAVMLPSTLLLNPVAAPGLVPYLNTGPGQVTSRLVKRKFIKKKI